MPEDAPTNFHATSPSPDFLTQRPWKSWNSLDTHSIYPESTFSHPIRVFPPLHPLFGGLPNFRATLPPEPHSTSVGRVSRGAEYFWRNLIVVARDLRGVFLGLGRPCFRIPLHRPPVIRATLLIEAHHLLLHGRGRAGRPLDGSGSKIPVSDPAACFNRRCSLIDHF